MGAGGGRPARGRARRNCPTASQPSSTRGYPDNACRYPNRDWQMPEPERGRPGVRARTVLAGDALQVVKSLVVLTGVAAVSGRGALGG
jgi:hypothetical protein